MALNHASMNSICARSGSSAAGVDRTKLPLARTTLSPLLLLRAVADATCPARKSELQKAYVR
jgi:hypothetical protein